MSHKKNRKKKVRHYKLMQKHTAKWRARVKKERELEAFAARMEKESMRSFERSQRRVVIGNSGLMYAY